MWPVIDAIDVCTVYVLCHVLILSFAALLITTLLTQMYRQRLTSQQNETYKVDFLPHHLICALLLSNEVIPIGWDGMRSAVEVIACMFRTGINWGRPIASGIVRCLSGLNVHFCKKSPKLAQMTFDRYLSNPDIGRTFWGGLTPSN